jgi:glutamyl-tRNA reductase
LVATASTRPVVSVAELSRAVSSRNGRMLWVVDLGVPRNVEPGARDLDRVRLYDLDDLQRDRCPGAGTASGALAEAERVIDDEIARLDVTLRGRIAAPRLAELHRLAREMAEEESEWALSQLGGLTEGDREIVREMADRLVRRVLYPVSRNLRSE